MTLLPILVFWALLAWGMAGPRSVLLYLFFATMPFGAFAVLPTGLTGGLTFTSTPMVALALVLRTFVRPGGAGALLGMALRPERLLLLAAFGVVAVIVTLFMPRLFAGVIEVVPVRGDLDQTVPLRPNQQNISQLAYLLIALASVFAFARLLRDPRLRQHAYRALCLGGAVAVLTGLLDLASGSLPLNGLLAPFRTASYALAVDVEVLGGKRVVGLMPEASAYGGLCLGFLCAIHFYRRAMWQGAVRDIAAPLLVLALIGCIWLARSSGAYVGFAVFVMLAVVDWCLRLGARGRGARRGVAGELGFVVVLVIGLCLVVIVTPHALDPLYELVDRMVLQKGSSESFEQRGMWRRVAFEGLLSSQGLGLGLGSARTSSSLVAILSGTGLLGGVLYYGFFLQCLLRTGRDRTGEASFVFSAFRFAAIPGFVVGLMVGSADFGGMLAFGFGLVSALADEVRSAARRRPVRHAPLWGPENALAVP